MRAGLRVRPSIGWVPHGLARSPPAGLLVRIASSSSLLRASGTLRPPAIYGVDDPCGKSVW